MTNNYIAISLKIFSVIFFVLMDVLIKKLSSDFNTFQIVFFRCFFGLFPVLIMMYITKSSLKTNKINLHLLRAGIACLAMFSFFKAFGILPLADVSSISFASIMIITILAIFILSEKVGIRRWIAIFFGFIGVLIVFRPGTSLFSYYSLLPLFGAVALSFAIIIMKKLLSYDTPPTCSFYLHAFVALIYLPFLIINWQQPSFNLWIMLIGMGFCGGIAQILLTNAYRLSTVNLLQPFDYTAIIWAITFGLIFFNDYPDRYVIIGSIVIVISTYYIIYREIKLGKKINTLKINQRHI
ncbi:DMT family transporter [Pelagibacteraceae bacterium]|nr:DMT family transporter [Pelagibacteraceae bacterium]